ncbi:MAG: enoyl-CoA hydratase/isomerase family protein [bacterium]|nr:enoyl-CoA hydratase/isomerase family protein [bacterium]
MLHNHLDITDTRESDRSVRRLMLNRPEKRNCLSIGLLRSLIEAVTSVPESTVVLSGSGPAFGTGLDLQEVYAAGSPREHLRLLVELFETLASHPAPTVSVVQAPAYGGGRRAGPVYDGDGGNLGGQVRASRRTGLPLAGERTHSGHRRPPARFAISDRIVDRAGSERGRGYPRRRSQRAGGRARKGTFYFFGALVEDLAPLEGDAREGGASILVARRVGRSNRRRIRPRVRRAHSGPPARALRGSLRQSQRMRSLCPG